MAKPDITLLGATYSGVSGVTLPKNGGGIATFPWVEGSETKTANGTYDVTNLAELVVNVSGGGGGLAYETGTYTPATDIDRPTINFANIHSKLPFFAMMVDADGYSSTSNSSICWTYVNWEQLNGRPIYVATNNTRYGEIRCTSRSSSASSLSSSTTYVAMPESDTGDSESSQPRYWVKPDSFRPYTNSTSRYWRAGRTYKWIAVWSQTS